MWAGALSDTTQESELRVSFFGLISFSLVRRRVSRPVVHQVGEVVAYPVQAAPLSGGDDNNSNNLHLLRELLLGGLKGVFWLVCLSLLREAYESGFGDDEIVDCVRGGENNLCFLE